ncbi:glycoside hydrolase family 78 protein [Micromonospora sp. NBRC 110038]|uniref:glycoside hydrolase family 78 protein n=1 Tax=Micromonospora sp. NBRC 110038 TaxID=1550034 RepID=UPI001E4C0848|nr:glycoside hydrolase family 78 protein [Micromonospora sp. NBRC 110038]
MSNADPAPRTTVQAPRVAHVDPAIGIGEPAPRLSFRVTDAPAGWRQVGYEVEVTGPDRAAHRSGRLDSADCVLVPWPAPPLRPRERCEVRVRVWGADADEPTPFSDPTTVEAGLDADDWQAEFVSGDWAVDPTVEQPPPLLRHEFDVTGEVTRARVYATALGVYELELNGARVGDQILAPGWTSYHHRLRYQTYDVTGLLRPGRNAVGGWLAEGWYAGRLGFHGGHRTVYGSRIGLLAQLEIEYADGRRQLVATDGSWRAATGPLTASGLLDGEHHDARREPTGWSSPGFAADGWTPVRVLPRPAAALVAPTGPPVRCVQEVPVAEVVDATGGRIILDFGQNLVGRLRITVTGPAGQTVRLRHAEVLQDGELFVRALRGAKATDSYTLRGGGVETWEPRFTFHGFRYAEVTGWPGEFDPAAVVARVHHTDMVRTGTFECSDPLVNRLHDNVVWSMRGNFLDIPTDCPQRDERLGWTGDIQVFAPTAAFLYDCAGMLSSWLVDLAAEQLPDGTVPYFVPRIPAPRWEPPQPTAVWGDAAVLTPWTLYERYGDRDVLARQYASAKAFVDLVDQRAGADHLWDSGYQLGDWLDPTAPPDDPEDAKADRYLVATAYFARSTGVLARMAEVLGRHADAQRYAALAAAVTEAFQRRYVLPSGLLDNDAQTSYALALRFGLVPAGGPRRAAARRLAELVEEAGWRIATGFAGTPAICDALADNGEVETAYRLLLSTDCPSWLYPVTTGATTIWERWDSLLPDGTVNPGQMTSFNHYALGAVADWLHRTVAGLAPAEPGYRRLLVRPRPGGGLRHARAALLTPYGPAAVGWRLADGELAVEVTVPAGATARVELPGAEPTEVGSGAHRFTVPWSEAA